MMNFGTINQKTEDPVLNLLNEVFTDDLLIAMQDTQIQYMNIDRGYQDAYNALEIARMAKATASQECMTFARELVGTHVRSVDITSSLEALDAESKGAGEKFGAQMDALMAQCDRALAEIKKRQIDVTAKPYVWAFVADASFNDLEGLSKAVLGNGTKRVQLPMVQMLQKIKVFAGKAKAIIGTSKGPEVAKVAAAILAKVNKKLVLGISK